MEPCSAPEKSPHRFPQVAHDQRFGKGGGGASFTLMGSVQAATPSFVDGAAQFSTTGAWPVSTAVTGFEGANYQTHEANGPSPFGLFDNTDSGFSPTGTWPVSTTSRATSARTTGCTAPMASRPARSFRTASAHGGRLLAGFDLGLGYVGTDYPVHVAGSGASTSTWTLAVPATGAYQAYARWTRHPNRATNARSTVDHAGGATVVMVNQEAGGGSWQALGAFSFNAGNTTVVSRQCHGCASPVR